jgi:hypothetical protein
LCEDAQICSDRTTGSRSAALRVLIPLAICGIMGYRSRPVKKNIFCSAKADAAQLHNPRLSIPRLCPSQGDDA